MAVEIPPCAHPLCELIGGACSLATRRSRGCRPNLGAREVGAEVLAEVRALVAAFDPAARTEAARAAAARLAALVRREALADRDLIAQLGDDEPALAVALARLCRRPPAGARDASG